MQGSADSFVRYGWVRGVDDERADGFLIDVTCWPHDADSPWKGAGGAVTCICQYQTGASTTTTYQLKIQGFRVKIYAGIRLAFPCPVLDVRSWAGFPDTTGSKSTFGIVDVRRSPRAVRTRMALRIGLIGVMAMGLIGSCVV